MERLLRYAIHALLFLLPWQTIWIIQECFVDKVKWEYRTIGFYATEALLWFAVILFIPWFYRTYTAKRQKEFRFTRDRIFICAVMLFTLYAFLSSSWSLDPDIAWQHALWILEAWLLFFLLLLGPVNQKMVWCWLALGSIVPSMLGIAQFLMQTSWASSLFGLALHAPEAAGTSIIDAGIFGRWLRAYGPFAHPNIFGGYLAVVTIAVDCAVRETKELKKRYLFIVISLISYPALFFTFSRSAWIGVILWTILSYKKTGLFLTTSRLGLIAILAMLFFPLLSTRAVMNTAHETRSIEERISGYTEARTLFDAHPLLGVGAGNYTQALRAAFPERPIWNYQPVHNTFLLLLTELGLVGSFFAILVCIMYFRLQITPQKLPLLVILPLLLFDHYLFSTHGGLLLFALFPILSTAHPQE